MTTEGVCTIYLVRHSESQANANKIVQGHTNSPLTEKGEAQSMKIADELRDVEFKAIFSSDLGRSIRTAEIVRLQRNLEIKTSPMLREKSYGIFEGMDHAKFIETLKEEFNRFDNELTVEERWNHKAHPSIESDVEIQKRFTDYIKEIINSHIGETVLVVSHRMPIRLFLVSIGCGMYENLKGGGLKNAGYAVLESNGQTFSVDGVFGKEM